MILKDKMKKIFLFKKVIFFLKKNNILLGDIITIIEKNNNGWWKGELNNKIGFIPSNFVEELNEIFGILKKNLNHNNQYSCKSYIHIFS